MARFGLALLAVAVSLLVGASGALAATVQVEHIYDKAAYTGDRIVLRAAAGEVNDVFIVRHAPGAVTVGDRVALDAGPGCEPITAVLARCMVRADLSFGLHASLGDGDDVLQAGRVDATYAKLLGGPGDDHLVGPADALDTRFGGGPGDDLMEGGHGSDVFRENAKRNGRDTMVAGSPLGSPPLGGDYDTVDYSLRKRPLRISMDGLRNDGEKGERDRIATDVEIVKAGSGADRLSGNEQANELVGGRGRDVVLGGAGDDHLIGDQYLYRVKRNQEDLVVGGPGDDRLEGGHGEDRLIGGAGHDSIVAGAGDDRVDANDGILDAVLCSNGRDRVDHDAADFMHADCGRQRGRIPPHVVPLFWADDGDRLSLALGCPLHRGVTCTATATLAVAGQTFGPRPFKLAPGRYAWLFLPLGARTRENPDPPLDGGVLTLSSTGPNGQVATESVPLSAIHRDPTPVSFFLPPVLPFL